MSRDMGMHTEQLAGRTQQVFFSATRRRTSSIRHAYEVDFNKRAEFDARHMPRINVKPPRADEGGERHHRRPQSAAKHSLGVGLLNRLQLYLEGSSAISAAG